MRQVENALAVLDATGTDRAVVVGLSKGARWALQLAATHGDRVLGTVAIGASVPLTDPHTSRAQPGLDPLDLPPSVVPAVARDPLEHWAKYDPTYWLERHEDFLWLFFGMCFPEPRSTKPIEDCVDWGLDTGPEVLAAEWEIEPPTRETVEGWCRAITSPVLAIHGDRDLISPLSRAERIAELTGGRAGRPRGRGPHPAGPRPGQGEPPRPRLRYPRGPATGAAADHLAARTASPAQVLYVSSPIGLGHARRDLAIARELVRERDDVQVDWLAQDPVTRFLEQAGERVHPASALAGQRVGTHRGRVRRARPPLLPGAAADGRDPASTTSWSSTTSCARSTTTCGSATRPGTSTTTCTRTRS